MPSPYAISASSFWPAGDLSSALVQRAVAVGIGRFEQLLNQRHVLALVDRAVAVGIGGLEVGLVDAARKLLHVERLVVVSIELLEHFACRGLGLGEIDGAVAVGIEHRHER